MKPYPLDRPVSLSIISWIPSIFRNKTHQTQKIVMNASTKQVKKTISDLWNLFLTFPKGSKIPRSISSVMLKCSEPTYRRIGPELPFCRLLAAAAALFFSACNYIWRCNVVTLIQYVNVEIPHLSQPNVVWVMFWLLSVWPADSPLKHGSCLFMCSVSMMQFIFRLSYHDLRRLDDDGHS